MRCLSEPAVVQGYRLGSDLLRVVVEHLDVQQGLDGLLQLLLVHLGAVLQLLVGHRLAVVEGQQHSHLVGGHHCHVWLGQVVHLHLT